MNYIKKLGSGLLVASVLLSSFNVQESSVYAQEGNIALNKQVSAVVSANGHAPELATDGDINTYWQSGNDYNRWIEIDLDGVHDVTSITVHTPLDFISQYDVYSSEDGINYDKVASKKDQVVETIDGTTFPLHTRACKIRVNITYSSLKDSTKGSSSNVGFINEVKVFGIKEEGSVTPIAPEIDIVDFDESEYGIRYSQMEQDVALKNQTTINEMYNLVGRVAGETYRNQFSFEIVDSTYDKDRFTIESKDGKIHISGENGIS